MLLGRFPYNKCFPRSSYLDSTLENLGLPDNHRLKSSPPHSIWATTVSKRYLRPLRLTRENYRLHREIESTQKNHRATV